MWQYYVLMALGIAGLFVNVNKMYDGDKLSLLDTSIHVVAIAICFCLWWSFLSVNWMWLSITIMLVVSALCMYEVFITFKYRRNTRPVDSNHVCLLCYILVATLFYIKYVN